MTHSMTPSETTTGRFGLRRKSRILALNALFLLDSSWMTVGDVVRIIFAEETDRPVHAVRHSLLLILTAAQHRKRIDAEISARLENWSLERTAMLDRNILRIAAAEFIACPQVPLSVVINEAIEIAREYSTPDSPRFVNGILDRIKHLRTGAPSAENSAHPDA